MNFIEGVLLKEDGKYYFEFGTEDTKTRKGVKYKILLPESKNAKGQLDEYIAEEKQVIAGIRPEHISDDDAYVAAHPETCVKAHVDVAEMMGVETYLYMGCEGFNINARVDPKTMTRAGDDITIAFKSESMHLFDADTEKTIVN